MKHLVIAAALLALSPSHPQPTPTRTGEWTARLSDSWTRNDGEHWVSFQLERDDDRRWGISIRLGDLEGFAASDRNYSGDARFTLKRDAGTIAFEGRFTDGRGRGSYRFTPHQDYVAALRQMGHRNLDDDDLLRLTAQDVSRPFIASMQAEGYKDATIDDLVRMRIHGVAPEFIRQIRDVGYKDLTVEQLVRLRIHGVTAEFVKEIRGLGYPDVTLDDVVRMRIHGVSPDFIREARAAGFKDLDADDLVDLSIHGRRWVAKRKVPGSRF